nr:ribonuclease H-like domain-containing protein [Tanacetum cinerariifolium]
MTHQVDKNVIDAGAKNRPSMLEKGMYDSWKSRIQIYIKGKENGDMLIDSIENGPFQLKKEITILLLTQDFHQKNNQLRTSSNPRTQATIQDGRVTIQNVQGRQSQGYAVNMGKSQAMGTRVMNTVRDETTNQPRLIRCYNCKDHVDAYDLDCDVKATTCTIFMASLSPAGSINGDTVGLVYDLDILFEVPHYDTYHKNDVLNSVVQETEYTKHLVSNNDSYDELPSDSNVIFVS